jgi:hypothetical protein
MFDELGSKETRAKKFQSAIVDPDLQAKTEAAYSNYFRKSHYNAMLEQLWSECAASEKDPERRVDDYEFKKLGYWLLANLIYINGNRRQAAVHFNNGDFATWQRANVEGTTHYSQVRLDRNEDLQDHHFVQFVIGGDKLAQIGKTNADIELIVPKDMLRGLVFYYTIKEHMGYVRPGDPFFVDTKNKAVSANNFYGTYLYTTMCREMGVEQLHFVQQRHNMATNMLKKGIQGKNTGMCQGTAIQEQRYDDLQQEAGIRNKIIANESLLQAPVVLDQVQSL